jgi:hypothetical protein
VEVNIGLLRTVLRLVKAEAVTEPPERLRDWLAALHRGVRHGQFAQ